MLQGRCGTGKEGPALTPVFPAAASTRNSQQLRGYQTVGSCDAAGRRIIPAPAGSPGIEHGSNVSVLREV